LTCSCAEQTVASANTAAAAVTNRVINEFMILFFLFPRQLDCWIAGPGRAKNLAGKKSSA
jgi:hypothetical protein